MSTTGQKEEEECLDPPWSNEVGFFASSALKAKASLISSSKSPEETVFCEYTYFEINIQICLHKRKKK